MPSVILQMPGQLQPRPEGQRPMTVGQAINDENDVNVDADANGRNDVESRQQFLQVSVWKLDPSSHLNPDRFIIWLVLWG